MLDKIQLYYDTANINKCKGHQHYANYEPYAQTPKHLNSPSNCRRTFRNSPYIPPNFLKNIKDFYSVLFLPTARDRMHADPTHWDIGIFIQILTSISDFHHKDLSFLTAAHDFRVYVRNSCAHLNRYQLTDAQVVHMMTYTRTFLSSLIHCEPSAALLKDLQSDLNDKYAAGIQNYQCTDPRMIETFRLQFQSTFEGLAAEHKGALKELLHAWTTKNDTILNAIQATHASGENLAIHYGQSNQGPTCIKMKFKKGSTPKQSIPSYPDSLNFSASERHIANIHDGDLNLVPYYSINSAYLLALGGTSETKLRRHLEFTLKWCLEKERFDLPEIHVLATGSAKNMGQGKGISKDSAKKLLERMQNLPDSNENHDERLLLEFLVCMTSETSE